MYSITSRRVLLRHGIAVPLTMNVPYTLVDNAALKNFSNGTGDIALALSRRERVGYLITWPHVRPGRFARPEPSFRALTDAEAAARILGLALAAQSAPATPRPTAAPRRRARPRRRRGRQGPPSPFPSAGGRLTMPPVAEHPKLPRGFIMAACGMALLSLVMASIARLTGYQPDRPPPSTAVEVRDLRFVDRPDGAVLVYDAADGRLTIRVQPGTNGFVRGVLRGLVRDRRAYHIGSGPPFRLTRWADGRLSLDDPSTGHHVDLEVFGPTNAGAFAEILTASGRPKETT